MRLLSPCVDVTCLCRTLMRTLSGIIDARMQTWMELLSLSASHAGVVCYRVTFAHRARGGAILICVEVPCHVRGQALHGPQSRPSITPVCSQILGDRVHASALIGAENAAEGGQDIGADTDWVHSDEAPPTARGTGEPVPRQALCSGAVA